MVGENAFIFEALNYIIIGGPIFSGLYQEGGSGKGLIRFKI